MTQSRFDACLEECKLHFHVEFPSDWNHGYNEGLDAAIAIVKKYRDMPVTTGEVDIVIKAFFGRPFETITASQIKAMKAAIRAVLGKKNV